MRIVLVLALVAALIAGCAFGVMTDPVTTVVICTPVHEHDDAFFAELQAEAESLPPGSALFDYKRDFDRWRETVHRKCDGA